jgi:predicted DNA-binding transcriptional regulator YafY
MKSSEHDKLVQRLAIILTKFNCGESISPHDLAAEFNVNVRTIQRDLNQRFSYLPLQKEDGRYKLEPSYLGQLSFSDIEKFALLAGIKGLFPSLSSDFVREIFDARLESSIVVKGHSYEDISSREPAFRNLQAAIKNRVCVNFIYASSAAIEKQYVVSPLKLLNLKGIWYLAGEHDGKLKTFTFSKINALFSCTQQFTPKPELVEQLVQSDSVWINEKPIEIVLKVAPSIAIFFKRRRLISKQVIKEETPDGGLILSCTVGHLNQLLPIVRYWMPNLTIVSPDFVRNEYFQQIREHIKRLEDDQVLLSVEG